jgi:hydrogenase-4 component F
MLNHAVTKALMFLSHGNIVRKYAKDGMSTIAGALRRMPRSGGMLTLGGLALVGTPPFNIFMSELIILWGAFSRFIPGKSPERPAYPQSVAGVALAIFVLSTTFIFYGLVNHLKKIVLGSPEKDAEREKFTWPALAPTFFLFVLMLVTGIWIVPPLANLVHESVQILLQLPE